MWSSLPGQTERGYFEKNRLECLHARIRSKKAETCPHQPKQRIAERYAAANKDPASSSARAELPRKNYDTIKTKQNRLPTVIQFARFYL